MNKLQPMKAISYQQTLHQAQSEVDTLHLSEAHTLHKVK